MSYCRWSSDNFNCEAYVYETSGGWSLTLAGNRFTEEIPKVPPFGTCSAEDFKKARSKQRDFLDEAKRVPIELPHRGESFIYESPGECAVALKEFIEIGYNIPQWVIGLLLEEQYEINEMASK